MQSFFLELFLNEYIFTFLITLISVLMKSYTSRENKILGKRETYDLGLEFVFIAISFASSNLAQLAELKNKLSNDKTFLLSQYEKHTQSVIQLSNDSLTHLKANLIQISDAIIQIELSFNNLLLITLILFIVLVLLSINIRYFSGAIDSELEGLWRKIIIPDVIGLLSIILVLTYIFSGSN